MFMDYLLCVRYCSVLCVLMHLIPESYKRPTVIASILYLRILKPREAK